MRRSGPSFRATADDGRIVTIQELEHSANLQFLGDPNAPSLETMKAYRTLDGQLVSRISDDEFEVRDTFGEYRVHRIP